MYIEKFKYPEVVKEYTSESGRVYYVKHNGILHEGLYSVTTILSRMTDTKAAIDEWRKLVGHEHADYVTNKSSNIGSAMHDILYHRLVGTKNYTDKFKQNFIFHLASHMADVIHNDYLNPYLDEVWGCEVPVFLPNYYAGRTDCVGLYKGIPSIVDFKNSYKEKDIDHMENYFIQCAAYALAHDFLFGTNIEQCVILIANSSDVTVREIIKRGEEFVKYKNMWLDMIEQYCNK